ncbi:hypothetical protein [Caldivirga sp. MU80]|uniref:hypothetical protein n=1 Tax=Caldivirga sp. MU80 TaxID=1650354 RepID=UPI000834BE28|nr:hypothetical protein [Caldivirga sp. MU80]
MPQALSLETPETLTMGELRRRLEGFDKDEYTGRYVLKVRGLGDVFVNGNVIKRFKSIEVALQAPGDWLASVRMWQGEYWLFRIASPTYVEVPGTVVLRAVKSVLPGVEKFGRWEAERLWQYEGAEYGEVTGVLGRDSHPRVGEFKYILRVTWGDDGYHAFRITKTIGVVVCENGLVMGEDSYTRVFHSRLNKPLPDKVREIINRIVNIINMERPSGDIERLMRPIEPKTVEDLSRRFPDFQRLYAEYKPQYGDTLLTVMQALGWIATHGSARNSERAISSMNKLIASLN